MRLINGSLDEIKRIRSFMDSLMVPSYFKLTRELQDPIRLFEDNLASRADTYFLIDRDELWREEIKRYLLTTSLPFLFTDQQSLDLGKSIRDQLSDMWSPGIERCVKCPNVVTRLTMPTGNLRPTIMVIAEAPGVGDGVKEGFDRVLVYGPTSYLLRESLYESGYYFETFFTNLLKCSLPGNRSGDRSEYDNCLPYLRKEVGYCLPKVVILFGSKVQSYFKNLGLTCRSRKSEIDKLGIFRTSGVNYAPNPVIISLPHPSWYNRSGEPEKLKDDLLLTIGEALTDEQRSLGIQQRQ